MEVLVCCWLFGAGPEQIQVVVHPQRVVHSMVEYADGSVIAESTEILRPMTQFGCAHASSGVTRYSSARERALKGPPDPVRRILRIPFATDSPATKGGRHWKIALCSLSMGSSIAPPARTVSMNTGPATTSASLFARRSFLPALAAASVARSPAAPTMAAMTQSTPGNEATSTSPASPASILQPKPAPERRSCSRGAGEASATQA